MSNLARHVCLGAWLLICAGCRSDQRPTQGEVLKLRAASPAAVEFVDRMRRYGVVTFRSWNGIAFRTDADTELVFFPDDTVEMLEYGYTLQRYSGTYRIAGDGRIGTRFERFHGSWSGMILDRDATSLLLQPASDAGFVMGGRGGAVVPGGEHSYWPFRMLSGADEDGVLQTLRRYDER